MLLPPEVAILNAGGGIVPIRPLTIIFPSEETATSLLRGNRDTLNRVIGLLLERETIDGADLAAIVAAVPGPADHEPAGAPLALT